MIRPLLTTKLHVPSLRTSLVPRPRLTERLNHGLQSHHRLTLISAPAGFGKTTLLGEWIQGLNIRPSSNVKVVWISLDEGDNDPVRFSAYLTAALQQLDNSITAIGEDEVELSGAYLPEPHFISLINQIAALALTSVLVVDDYHLITSQQIHDTISFLLENLPDNFHLVLATRADPPIPLPRLRARDQLTELRQSDLRFTTEEAAAFLNQVMGINLSPKEVAALESRTEGWIAGLQMAALSLQKHAPDSPDRSELVQAFTGSHRYILDYLVEEVLEQQPPIIQEFLLKTSILRNLSGSLCDAILKVDGSTPLGQDPFSHFSTSQFPSAQSILEHLETANLFIVPLDNERQWYRYHRLFADLLNKRLLQTSPELVSVLQSRAGTWYQQAGFITDAIDYALDAGDFDRAISLIEENAQTTLMRSEIVTFRNWMERLPEASVRAHPTLHFFHAWALLMSGGPLDIVEQVLQDIISAQGIQGEDEVTSSRIRVLRAYILIMQADMPRAAQLCRQALEHLPQSDQFLRSIATWILSLSPLFDGNFKDGAKALNEITELGRKLGSPLIVVTALCYQAKLQKRRGRLIQAQEILEQALQFATDSQGRRLPIASEALIGLGDLKREWNDLDAAAKLLTESIRLANQWSELSAFDAYFPLVRTRLAQGDQTAARQALDDARKIALQSKITDVDDLVSDLQQAQFAIMQQDVAAASRWAEKKSLTSDFSLNDLVAVDDYIGSHLRKYELITWSRLLILQGKYYQALELLNSLLLLVRQLDRIDLTIEIQILRALACQKMGQNEAALESLTEALSLAEPGGHLRIFLDEGEEIFKLLNQAATQGVAPVYVKKLLSAFDDAKTPGGESKPLPVFGQPLIDPLSERELEVLQLLATGKSNPEIAAELVVAVSTVRSHCKSIYSKLNVHKRWDAVQRARELGLL